MDKTARTNPPAVLSLFAWTKRRIASGIVPFRSLQGKRNVLTRSWEAVNRQIREMCRQRLRLGLGRRHEGLGVVHHDEPAESGAGEGRNVNEVAQGSGILLKRSTPDIARGRRAGAA